MAPSSRPGHTESMHSDEIRRVAASQKINRAAVQAECGVAQAEGKHELANMLRALQIILEDAEANPGVFSRAKQIVPAW